MNPYSHLSPAFSSAYDYISQHLPVNPSPTFDDLNEQLFQAIIGGNATTMQGVNNLISVYVRSVLPHVYNGYMNIGSTGGYAQPTEKQAPIIAAMLEGINKVPVESIGDFISNMEEKITKSGLLYEEQIPLFLATAAARSTYTYFLAQISQPGSWSYFMNPVPALNYANLAGWSAAAFQGALLSFSIIKPDIQFLDLWAGMMGSVGLVSGKVVFRWVGNN